jgi:hypothetical protein
MTQDFGQRCLVARRMVERGVRFVQVWSGAGGLTNNWDNHANIQTELPPMCAVTDKPIAGLLIHLKQRGQLDDTLVLWNTESGGCRSRKAAPAATTTGASSLAGCAAPA